MSRQSHVSAMGKPGHSGIGSPVAFPAPTAFPATAATAPSWSFTFSDDLSTVTGATMTAGTHSRTLDITNATFTTETGTNDLGVNAVVSVTETRTDGRGTHTSLLADQDGDGAFASTLDIVVASASDHLRTHSFTFDSDGAVTGETWSGHGKGGHFAAAATYETVELDGVTYVVSTTTRGDDQLFEIARDDDGDGVWTVIASGHSDTAIVDTTTHTFALDNIDYYLATSSGIIG